MKWLITAAALASLMTTPVSAARQHLNRDEYWNMTPVAQIFPLGDTWNEIIAAPVFGRPEAAAAGKLFVVAGGDAAAIRKAAPAS
jgi:hypothetical protein